MDVVWIVITYTGQNKTDLMFSKRCCVPAVWHLKKKIMVCIKGHSGLCLLVSTFYSVMLTKPLKKKFR